jgi:hypothetical protein
MGWEGPTADTAETPASTLMVAIAKIREDIRGLSLGCHDYVPAIETPPPPKSLHPILAADRGFG